MKRKKISEILKTYFPSAKFGTNSGLPYIAVPANNMGGFEKIVNLIPRPFLVDLKNGFLVVRFAENHKQVVEIERTLAGG